MDESTIKTLLLQQWDLHVSHLKKLVGYDDANYRITSVDGQVYLLKIAQQDESNIWKKQAVILEHLAKNKILSSQFIRTPSGDVFTMHGHQYARLLNWMEGSFDFIDNRAEPKIYRELGTFIAKLHDTLEQMPGDHSLERITNWDLAHISLSRVKLENIQDHEVRRVCHHFIFQLEQKLKDHHYDIPKSIIHNDLNPDNLLLTSNGEITVIDWGDMCHSYLVGDLAIAMTYAATDRKDPMPWMLSILKSYYTSRRLTTLEIEMIYYFVAGRMATSIASSADSENDYISKDRKSMIRLLLYWIQLNPIHVETRFKSALGLNCAQPKSLTPQRSKYFSKSMSVTYRDPIQMASAAMQYMYSSDGNTYVDCVNNICHVGHTHPRLIEAMQNQAAKLNTNTRYLYDIQYEYAEQLLSHFPKKLNKVFFVNSGSEALELATRLAKTHTQRSEFIVMDMAYHGHSNLAIELSPYKFKRKGGFEKRDHVHIMDLPDTSSGKTIKEFSVQSKKYLESNRIAAFIAESISGCGGQFVYPKEYLHQVYTLAREHGTVCIADEVQTGFGRTGYFWAFEHYDVVPDIVMIGKPIGNGHPMAAVVTTSEICESFENGMEFFSSFGGNPVSCAVGKAVLDIIADEGLVEHAKEMQSYMLNSWNKMKAHYSFISDARGLGLFLGLEFKDPVSKKPMSDLPKKLKEWMKLQGYLLSTDGAFEQVIKFKPPMCFTKLNADDMNGKFWQFFETMPTKF